MADRVKGMTALVTGGSRSIGRALALGLAREGADVAINYVARADKAEEVVAEIRRMGRRAVAVRADVSKRAEIDAMVAATVKALGRLDIMVNNAAQVRFVDFFDTTEEIWDTLVDTNLKGTFFCMQAAARVMRDQGGNGRIINISSAAGIRANPMVAAYGATKAGINILTKAVARALAPHKIRVNAIVAATTWSDVNAERFKDPAVPQEVAGRTPLGRLAYPEDYVGACVYLASDESEWVTGAEIVVDGGITT